MAEDKGDYSHGGSLLEGLGGEEVKLLQGVADALRTKVEWEVSSQSDICSMAFVKAFESRLKIYHALNDEVLNKKTFEYAFANAARAAGHEASVTENSVNPGADVLVDGIAFSLKTEASGSIRPKKIKISKLMEARWIRDCRTGQEFVDGVQKNVVTHLQKYQRIMILRAFKIGRNAFKYRLIEIPTRLLLLVQDVAAADFGPRSPNGSSRVAVFENNQRIFDLRLDGSVEKITVEGLDEDQCLFHAEWVIPVGSVVV